MHKHQGYCLLTLVFLEVQMLVCLLAGERVDGIIILACCMTVTSVFFIVSQQKPRAER